MNKPFVGVDGETIEDAYCLIAAGDAYKRGPLSFEQYCRFLFSTVSDNTILVSYSFTYDVSMMFGMLPDEMVKKLFSGEPIQIGRFEVQYYTRKMLIIRVQNSHHRSVTIYDVFTFFHTSFIGALGKFGIDVPESVKWGKEARVAFKEEDFDHIVEYNHQECILLAELCEKFRRALSTAGIHPTSWHGPGALASVVMRDSNVRAQMGTLKMGKKALDERLPGGLLDAWTRAYFGGRIESFKLGRFGKITSYDINSAYPSAILELSALVGRWRVSTSYSYNSNMSVWHCEWNVGTAYVGPFPWRGHNGNISFPMRGAGWYWQPEVRAALEVYPGCVKVTHGWIFDNECSLDLADSVRGLYARRKQFEHNDEPLPALAIKLTLNSLYGKMAQSIGRGEWLAPPWAGYVTSHTRARLLRAVAGHERSLVTIATDGIYLEGDVTLDVDTGEWLGQWKRETFDHGFFIGNGIYRIWASDGREKRGTRGAGRIDFEDAYTQVCEKGEIVVRDHIFVTPVVSIHSPLFFGPHRCRWMDTETILAPWKDKDNKRIYHWNGADWSSQIIDSDAPQGSFFESWLPTVDWKAEITGKYVLSEGQT